MLGCCDVVIATADSNIGMGGPAMIEGGGLGVFDPTEIGPMSVQQSNGVVDIAVADEAEAVAVAKQYLSYFQGPVDGMGVRRPARAARTSIPEDRKRRYDVRTLIETMFDTGSVLELRRDFGLGMVTAFARVEGRPVGVVANNPSHLAGAIDSDGADKAARFMQLCDAFDIPIVTLVDTPGMMVGPGGRGDRAGAALLAAVRDRRQRHGADGQRRPAQELRPRRAGDDGRQHQGARGVRRLANRRVRRHGPGGRGAARLPQRARGDRGSRRARAQLPGAGRPDVRTRQGVERRVALRDRRRDRSRRHAAMAHRRSSRRRHRLPPRVGKKRPNIDTW